MCEAKQLLHVKIAKQKCYLFLQQSPVGLKGRFWYLGVLQGGVLTPKNFGRGLSQQSEVRNDHLQANSKKKEFPRVIHERESRRIRKKLNFCTPPVKNTPPPETPQKMKGGP